MYTNALTPCFQYIFHLNIAQLCKSIFPSHLRNGWFLFSMFVLVTESFSMFHSLFIKEILRKTIETVSNIKRKKENFFAEDFLTLS